MEFYKYWRSRSNGSDFRNEFPYELSLGGSNIEPFWRGRPSSLKRTRRRFNACCTSASTMCGDQLKEQCSPGSPASVRAYDQISTPCDNSLMDPSSREFQLFMLAWLIPAQQVVLSATQSKSTFFTKALCTLNRWTLASLVSPDVQQELPSHMDIDRLEPGELGAPHHIFLEHLASPNISPEPRPMGGVDQGQRGCSIGDASMENGGVDERVPSSAHSPPAHQSQSCHPIDQLTFASQVLYSARV